MPQVDDLSHCRTAFDQASTLLIVVDMGQSSWLAAAMVSGVARNPLKKLEPDPEGLLGLVRRWQAEAEKVGHPISRIALAFEAGRDGFWLARWLCQHGIETYVIHSTSIPVSREHRRAKTDRLDTALLMRVFLGWMRGERGHCQMVAIPTLEEEDARRPSRERQNLVGERTRIINRMKARLAQFGIRGFKPELRRARGKLAGLCTPEGQPLPPNMMQETLRDMDRLDPVRQQIAAIEQVRLARLTQEPASDRRSAMVALLVRVRGVGIETADMLVNEVLSRTLQGWNGNDVLRGGAGADRLEGGAGIDTASHWGKTTGVTVNLATGMGTGGNAQGDILVGIENVNGGKAGDVLIGSSGANALDGYEGNDVLRGGAGQDILTGGSGGDRFVFAATGDSAVGANADRITDFSHAQGDRIDLSAIDAASGVAGNQAFTFIGSGAFTHHAGQLRAAVTSPGLTTIAGDVNGDGVSDFHARRWRDRRGTPGALRR